MNLDQHAQPFDVILNNETNRELMEKGVGLYDVDVLSNFLAADGIEAGDDRTLRRGVRRLLDEAGLKYEMDVSPSGGGRRVDFFVGGVALICVSDRSLGAAFRQLERLAASSSVDGILIVTTRDFVLSAEIWGKPTAIVRAG